MTQGDDFHLQLEPHRIAHGPVVVILPTFDTDVYILSVGPVICKKCKHYYCDVIIGSALFTASIFLQTENMVPSTGVYVVRISRLYRCVWSG